jgi:hypothetical protein
VEKENKLFGEHKITQEEKSPTIKIAGACGKTTGKYNPKTNHTQGRHEEKKMRWRAKKKWIRGKFA